MPNTEQQNSILMWRYLTLIGPFIKCNICNVFYERNDAALDEYYLKKHLERKHSYIIEEIKKEIKSTWWSRYFAFNVKYESIKCIFCKDDIQVLDVGVNYLRHHILNHNIHEHTINYLTDDETMQLNLSPEIYTKIIQKLRDDITSAGLSFHFIFDDSRYGCTKMKCARCVHKFNILINKKILKGHLFLYHNISK